MDLNNLAIELFCQFDPEKKGFITKEELLNVSNREGPFSEVQVLSIFSLLDKDNKGVITLSDFTNAFLDVSDTNDKNDHDTIETESLRSYYTNEEDIYEDEYIDDENQNRYLHDHENQFIGTNETDFIIEDECNEREFLRDEVQTYDSDEDVSDSISDDIGTNDRYMSYGNYNNNNNGGERYTNGHIYDSIENVRKTSSANDNRFRKISRTRSDIVTKYENNDDYWWEYGKPLNGFHKNSAFFKRESLPSLKCKEKGNAKKYSKCLRKWKSCDAGINQCYIASNKKADFSEDGHFNSTTHRLKKTNLIKRLSDLKLNQLQNEKYKNMEHKNEKLISRELDGIFGTTNRKVSLTSSSCTCLNNQHQKLNHNNHQKQKYMSQNSLNILSSSKTMLNRYHTISRTHSYRDLDPHENEDHMYNNTSESIDSINGYFRQRSHDASIENLSSINQTNGVYASRDSILSPRDYNNEDWQSYLKRMQCVALFGGNQSLRFIWQQIGAYQKELLIPLEDFLKAVVEEHKSVYTKCQDVESNLHLKIEQHEKEVDQLYEEFDRTTAREIDLLEKKHYEREEILKTEYRKILEQKEQAYQDNLKYTLEITTKLENNEIELDELHADKKKIGDNFRSVLSEQQILLSESEDIVNENNVLKEKLSSFNDNVRELQDHLNQMTKNYKKEKEKHSNIIRRFKDLLEEKEFLEVSLTAISTENEDLRNINKTQVESLNSSIILSTGEEELEISSLPSLHSSPLKASDKKCSAPHGLSLHEEMNDLEFQLNFKPIDLTNNLEFTLGDIKQEDNYTAEENAFVKDYNIVVNNEYKNNNSNQNLTITRVFSPLEEIVLQDEDLNENNDSSDFSHESTVTESSPISHDEMMSNAPLVSGIRFASAVQSEYKVILCGDACVGKTSLIHRICFNKFSNNREVTMQLDSYKKLVVADNSTIVLNLWDTVGQERFNSLPRSYYRKTDVVLLVYDITEESSFTNAKSWLRAIHDFTHDNVLILLVGNKIDLSHRRRISYARGEKLATENDAIYVETSAKSSENISNMLRLITRTLLAQNDYVFIHNYFERSATTNLMRDTKNANLMKSNCC